jgi:hypothetical protein
LSFLWRSVKAKLPENLLGWETGTVEITSPITATAEKELSDGWSNKRLKIWTTEVDRTLSSKNVQAVDGKAIVWEIEEMLRLPGEAI